MTFFIKENVNIFDRVLEGGDIKIIPLLEASRGIVDLIDLFGVAFGPVKKDVLGNIEKLNKKNEGDKNTFGTLKEILEDEKGQKTKNKVATDAGIWLNRGLQFLAGILRNLQIDYVSKTKDNAEISENIKGVLDKAYKDSLKPYHGWIVGKVFSGCAMMAPYRKDLEKKLCLEKEDIPKEQLYREVEAFLDTMEPVLKAVVDLYESEGIDQKDFKA